MVLQLRDHNGVPRRELITQRVRHQVQCFGGVFGERNLLIGRTHKRGNVSAGLFVGVGGFFRQLVCAPMHWGVMAKYEVFLRPPHPQWPLAGRPGVEVHQGFIPPDGAGQDGEFRADGCLVECAIWVVKTSHNFSEGLGEEPVVSVLFQLVG